MKTLEPGTFILTPRGLVALVLRTFQNPDGSPEELEVAFECNLRHPFRLRATDCRPLGEKGVAMSVWNTGLAAARISAQIEWGKNVHGLPPAYKEKPLRSKAPAPRNRSIAVAEAAVEKDALTARLSGMTKEQLAAFVAELQRSVGSKGEGK